MTTAEPTRHTRRPRRARRIVRAVVLSLVAVIVIAVAGFLIWANTGVMQAEPGPLAAVRADPAISVHDTDSAVVMAPTGAASGVGLVFMPGAKVDAHAYLYKLSGAVAQDGLTVVITKPILNLAFFDLRPLSSFTDQTHAISTWYVGGHSLGGVRACQYAQQPNAQQPNVHRLILFGSYCANNLSRTGLDVLSLSGSNDGLSTPQKIRQSAHLLPADATFVEIAGANHARFGDYGVQPGDGKATVSSSHVRSIINHQEHHALSARTVAVSPPAADSCAGNRRPHRRVTRWNTTPIRDRYQAAILVVFDLFGPGNIRRVRDIA